MNEILNRRRYIIKYVYVLDPLWSPELGQDVELLRFAKGHRESFIFDDNNK